MTKDDLIEALAYVEHQRWAELDVYLDIDVWERRIATPYADLSEEGKASDRTEVMRYLPLIVDFVAEWLTGLGIDPADLFVDDLGQHLAERWREDVAS
jgi:hypothetical protein